MKNESMTEMNVHIITIWKAKDKFDNPSRAIYGERLIVEVLKPENRKNPRLKLTRQFKSYFEWYDMNENGRLDVTITRSVLDGLITVLKELRRETYGDA